MAADDFEITTEEVLPGEVPGFRSGAVHCGLKRTRADGRKPEDLAVLLAERPAAAAGVFTTNRAAAAPVRLSRERVKKGIVRAVVVDAGNANCATGEQGRRDAEKMAELTAGAVGCAPEEVLVCSTGIIGVPLPMAKITQGIAAAAGLAAADGGGDFCQAILTTDTTRKHAAVRGTLGGKSFVISGAAKGSGMIAPRMATMLAFLTTDLAVAPEALQAALAAAVNVSFNRITVDGDTSTNDTVIALASGLAGNQRIERAAGAAYELLREALTEVCGSLSRQIVRDGEGATKFVTFRVRGAADEADAEKVARTVAESLLVKTALFGSDANWGRILAAAGRSGAAMQTEKFRLALEAKGGEIVLFADGAPATPDEKREKRLAAAMKERELTFSIDLGLGKGAAVVRTCDLSYDYVRINAEYHT